MDVINIVMNKELPAEMLYYIADCWIEFVTQDLGLEPCDLLMVLPG